MSELQVAVKAARAAAEVLRDTMGADLGISYKDARANLVTVADKQSQQVITEVIAGAFPDPAFVGEEATSGEPGPAARPATASHCASPRSNGWTGHWSSPRPSPLTPKKSGPTPDLSNG